MDHMDQVPSPDSQVQGELATASPVLPALVPLVNLAGLICSEADLARALAELEARHWEAQLPQVSRTLHP